MRKRNTKKSVERQVFFKKNYRHDLFLVQIRSSNTRFSSSFQKKNDLELESQFVRSNKAYYEFSMSGETQSHSRKRRDRKKKKEEDDHEGENKDDVHHESSAGVLSTVVFFLLLGGLVVLTGVIFIELKGSKEVGPSITESRYASILGDLVDEHLHDHEEEEEHEPMTSHYDGHDDGDGEDEDEEGVGKHDSSSYHAEGEEEEEEAEEEEDLEVQAVDSTEAEQMDVQQQDEELDAEKLRDAVDITTETKDVESDDSSQPQLQDTKFDVESEVPSETKSDEPSEEAETAAPLSLEDELPTEAEIPVVEQERLKEPFDSAVVDHVEEKVEEIDALVVESNAVEDEISTSSPEQPPSEEPVSQPPLEEQVVSQTPLDEPVVLQPPTEERPVLQPPLQDIPDLRPASEEPFASEPVSEELPTMQSSSSESPVRSLPEEPSVLQPPSDDTGSQEPLAADVDTSDIREPDESVAESTEPPPDPWAQYERADITNQYDYEFHEELDRADEELERSAERGKKTFESLLRQHPRSPRAAYGRAKALDRMSEEQRSNALLEASIAAYEPLLELPEVPDRLYRQAGERCADRMRFRGFTAKATRVQEKLVQRFPDDVALRNQLAVSYLLLGQNEAARKVLREVLRIAPEDGFAKVHYGFILKTEDSNYKTAIKYLQEGIETGEPGTIDGRFFFHLGDALAREGFPDKARKVYEDGVKKGLFLSAYQRSLYNVDSLTGRPWWTAEQTTYSHHLKKLEDRWQVIRREGLALLNEKQTGFLPESENLRDTGVWKQFELFARGKKIAANCARAPQTCQLIEGIPDAAGCKRGQVKFSVVHPGTHVWAHTGPTNCRIRAHLGLAVPDGALIRVANETRSWVEGKFIIFDDSFEHEVWHDGTTPRLVLIVDFWHPELTDAQKRTLSPI